MSYKRYADFSGRSQRMEYWLFSLFFWGVIIAIMALAELSGALGESEEPPSLPFVIPLALFILASFIPSVAVTVRRLHDQDKSGWFYLLSFIPYVGGIILFVLMCIGGTRGPNRYGPDPRGEAGDIFG